MSRLPVVEHYDRVMFDHYLTNVRQGGDGYCNFGYWTPTTSGITEAHHNLLCKLLEFLPVGEKATLDVACGKGASTRDLGFHFGPGNITGINISTKQLLACQRTSPGSRFVKMDAARLGFRREIFEYVICIEAAFHFNTRVSFLAEAFRVLKPGGRLAMTDILSVGDRLCPPNQQPTTLPEYARCLRRIGYANAKLVDATENCTDGFCNYADNFDRQHLSQQTYLEEIRPRIRELRASCRPYVHIFAEKPV